MLFQLIIHITDAFAITKIGVIMMVVMQDFFLNPRLNNSLMYTCGFTREFGTYVPGYTPTSCHVL